MNTVINTNSHMFAVGDRIKFVNVETRWWRKLINWLFRIKKDSETFVITSKPSDTEIEINMKL